MKEQPGNENDLEPWTTIASRQEATKRQLSPSDQVFVNEMHEMPGKDLRE